MDSYDAVVLGAGPSGLAAAYCLAKQRARVAVVERSPHVGGLMRGIQRGEFSLDLGRKELYTRYPEVDGLWSELLGSDFREYPHRVGALHGGRILELENSYKGRFRGMSAAQIGQTLSSALLNQITPGSRKVANLEDYYVLRYGRAYYNFFVYGYMRKFDGREPRDLPGPRGVTEIPRFALLLGRGQAEQAGDQGGREKGQVRWRHPARGTQQIADAFAREAAAGGVPIMLNTEVLGLNVDGGKLRSVVVRKDGVESTLQTRHAIVGLPAPLILKLLRPEPPPHLRQPPREEIAFKKSTALVYLMADGEARFPHNWLHITDMRFRMGRVVNYGTWNGNMVPKGKTALCVEYFSVEGDGIMELSKDELLKLAISEARQNGLIDADRIFDHLVIQMPAVNAATVFTDWRGAWMKDALAWLHGIEGLIETNRPGTDRATLAGIDAAQACLTGKPMSDRSLQETIGWE